MACYVWIEFDAFVVFIVVACENINSKMIIRSPCRLTGTYARTKSRLRTFNSFVGKRDLGWMWINSKSPPQQALLYKSKITTISFVHTCIYYYRCSWTCGDRPTDNWQTTKTNSALLRSEKRIFTTTTTTNSRSLWSIVIFYSLLLRSDRDSRADLSLGKL